MNSVYIIAFFLLRASFCTAIKERAAKRTWVEVTPPQVDKENEFKYVALLTTETANQMCLGSILSEVNVLTYCAGSPKKAYAGLLKVDEATNTPQGNVQLRTVDSVVENDKVTELKICKVDKWNLNAHVGTVSINNGKRQQSYSGCQVVGFRKKDGATTESMHVLEDLKISSTDDCNLGSTTAGILYTLLGDDLGLAGLDLGGPAVCGGFQRGISTEYNTEKKCISYIDIATHSDWIDKQIKPAESGEPSGSNGTSGGSNGTDNKPSSAYSIHSYLYKYSNWKVILLCLLAIKVLVY